MLQLRELLELCQKQLSAEAGERRMSLSSNTSSDSTGSLQLETRDKTATSEEEEGKADLPLNGEGGRKRGLNGCLNGGVGGGGETKEEAVFDDITESCDRHIASPDSGHVTLPPGTPPPLPHEARGAGLRKQRSFSTNETMLSHSLDVNGDMTNSSLDDIFSSTSPVTEELKLNETNQLSQSLTCRSIQQLRSTDVERGGRSRSFKLTRRDTVPADLQKRIKRSSVISSTPSFGSTRRVFANIAGTSNTPIPQNSILLGQQGSLKRTPTHSIPNKKPQIIASAGSPIHTNSPRTHVLKVVLAGTDLLLCHTARAYAQLLAQEPNLFLNLDVRFYHIPLSAASSADWMVPERNQAVPTAEHPEEVLTQLGTCGYDVNVGRYLSHLDSWYERNVALAIHHTMRLIPEVSPFLLLLCV